ncbi:MAG: hypothetical protein ACXVFN_02880 [Solirubrobacteraceae bacterium]
MPATTKPKAAGAKRAPARKQPTSLDYIQKAIEDLDKARKSAGEELRKTIDTAMERLRKATSDMRSRAGDEATDFEEVISRASEEVRRDLGRRAVHAQQTPEALTELSSEIRKRKAELVA